MIDRYCKRERGRKYTSFTSFDVESFYPAITEALLLKVLDWAADVKNIPQEDKSLIIEACKNILVKDGVAWVKSSTGLHDITMGSFSGAEVCELVGLFMLQKLRDIGLEAILYRDEWALIS